VPAVHLRSTVVSAYQVTACDIVFNAGKPHWAWASSVRFHYHTQTRFTLWGSSITLRHASLCEVPLSHSDTLHSVRFLHHTQTHFTLWGSSITLRHTSLCEVPPSHSDTLHSVRFLHHTQTHFTLWGSSITLRHTSLCEVPLSHSDTLHSVRFLYYTQTHFTLWGSSITLRHTSLCEVPLSHSDTLHSVGLVRKSDLPVAETSTWQHTTLTTDRHSCPRGICSRNPSRRAAADRRLRPHGKRDRPPAV